jgi:hypothetical protein
MESHNLDFIDESFAGVQSGKGSSDKRDRSEVEKT